MLCNPVKFIKPQFPTNINSLLKVLVLVFTRGLTVEIPPTPNPFFWPDTDPNLFILCIWAWSNKYLPHEN